MGLTLGVASSACGEHDCTITLTCPPFLEGGGSGGSTTSTTMGGQGGTGNTDAIGGGGTTMGDGGSGGNATGGGGGANGGGGSGGCDQVDVIIVLDSGASMGSERAIVESTIVNLYQAVEASALDARYLLLTPGATDANGICAPSPMGSGNCSSDESLPPKFVHHPIAVSDPLDVILNQYLSYSGTLRGEARKHLVVITDDNSATGSTAFHAALIAIAPPMFHGYGLHGIFSYTACPTSQAVGTAYSDLVALTDGVSADQCNAFDGALGTIGSAVAASVSEPCH